MSTVISGPVAPYSNPPIEPQYYLPSQFIISNVSLGVLTTVTTTANMNYVIGQLVRLLIPPLFGCRQLNQKTGYVIGLPMTNQVQIAINSSLGVDAYIAYAGNTTQPQIVSVGDINTGQTNNQGRAVELLNIPGSFINISPA